MTPPLKPTVPHGRPEPARKKPPLMLTEEYYWNSEVSSGALGTSLCIPNDFDWDDDD